MIRLDTGTARFRDLEIRDKGRDTVIDTGAGTITLIDLAADDLSAGDFLLV